jgi:antitoxin PrlF
VSTTLTAKGQVTIPKKIRDTLGLAPGSAVDFDIDEQGRVVICKAGEKPIRPTASTAPAGGSWSNGALMS